MPSAAAVVVDLLVMTGVTLAAAYGRMRLPFFNAVGDVDNLVAIVGVPIVLGWVAAIALTGGYASHVMGAGHHRVQARRARGRMVAAGATGVVCYLMKFQFSRGFFFLLIIVGVPALLRRPPRAAPGDARAAPPRVPGQPGRRRRLRPPRSTRSPGCSTASAGSATRSSVPSCPRPRRPS